MNTKPLSNPGRAARSALSALLICIVASSEARATYYSSDTADGYASLESGFAGSATTVRAGGTLSMTLRMGTKGSTKIDYGTSLANIDQVVSGPYWLNPGLSNLSGNFGPDAATARFLYRGTTKVYFHLTFYPSYAEANLGFFDVNVRGCYVSFAALPVAISQGDTFSATAVGGDDDGRLASTTIQVSVNGSAWSTLSTVGPGNGSSSTTPVANLTAGAAGTTYQFRAWATDNNGYQSSIVTSGVYATGAPPPPTNYLAHNGADIGTLFRARVGGATAAPTGLTCVINGVTYDLADLFVPRSGAARPAVGIQASNGLDISQIFEAK